MELENHIIRKANREDCTAILQLIQVFFEILFKKKLFLFWPFRKLFIFVLLYISQLKIVPRRSIF